MRNLMFLILVTFLYNAVVTAQVKDQFRDRDNSSTIVVVKEDNANDQKVLNEHFDLADMSMSDQIMITTVPEQTTTIEAPDMENATASTDDSIEDFFEDFSSEEVEVETEKENISIAETIEEVPNTSEKEVISETKMPSKIVKSSSRVATKRAKGTYAVKSSAQVKKAAQKKYFGKKKRKKNKKRKFFGKKKSNSCYNF